MLGRAPRRSPEASNLNSRINRVETNLRQEMSARIDSLHQELHSTARRIIGTVFAAAGMAVALIQPLR